MNFSEIKENILENKKRSLLIAFICVFIILLIILLTVLRKTQNRHKPAEKQKIILSEDLLIPTGPEVQQEYSITRQAKEKWTDEEADAWFTSPSDKDLEALEKSNDNMILDVVGAAP